MSTKLLYSLAVKQLQSSTCSYYLEFVILALAQYKKLARFTCGSRRMKFEILGVGIARWFNFGNHTMATGRALLYFAINDLEVKTHLVIVELVFCLALKHKLYS